VLAVAVVAVVAVAAAAFLLYTARHSGNSVAAPPASPTASTKARTKAPSPSASPSATDHIATRSADPSPLTVSQLFPASFTLDGRTYTLVTSKTGKSCSGAIVGSKLQSAVKAAQCSQVVRATYVSPVIKVMGTIGVLNLSTAASATKAGQATGAANFIAQLKGRRGPTRGLGRGAGIEEAASKGHYLILLWAQFTTHHRPRTVAQKTRLENFMQAVWTQTANISLTKRMVNGAP
jgi:hypothetical protein